MFCFVLTGRYLSRSSLARAIICRIQKKSIKIRRFSGDPVRMESIFSFQALFPGTDLELSSS